MFEIENSPLPPKTGRGRKSQYPWKDVAKGQSFIIPYTDGKTRQHDQTRACVLAAKHWGSGEYTTQCQEAGIRVFRLA